VRSQAIIVVPDPAARNLLQAARFGRCGKINRVTNLAHELAPQLPRGLHDFGLAFRGLRRNYAGGVDGDIAGIHRLHQFRRTVVDNFLGLLVGLVVAEPSFFRRKLTGLNAGLNFRNIFRKFDVRPMTLPSTGRNLEEVFPKFGGGMVAYLCVRCNTRTIAGSLDVCTLPLPVAERGFNCIRNRNAL
jgi:hypothetical protein